MKFFSVMARQTIHHARALWITVKPLVVRMVVQLVWDMLAVLFWEPRYQQADRVLA